MLRSNGYYSGHVGQLDATFAANQNIVTLIREKHSLYDFKGLIKLGIQAPVGTKFCVNGEQIRIGATGIYELDLTNGIQITKITVDPRSIKEIKENQNAYLIIDIIYDDGKE